MNIDEIKKNCKYADHLDDTGTVICEDGGYCECSWQVKEGAYFDCDNYETLRSMECKIDSKSEWHKHYCINNCTACKKS